jgi:hypothetical protein
MGELLNFRRAVNGVSVEQRTDNGFVNGTAMCAAHGKDVSDWLKTDDTWELVNALADDIGIFSKSPKSGNSDYTRVSATFPDLVMVKRGSPDNGGGTWLHPDLAMQLAQWCNKRFAIQVSRWIREWLTIGQVPIDSDAEQEYVRWQQRYDIRIELKNVLRPELMNAVVLWAQNNGMSPQTLCSDVHDVMNERIQGAKAQQIRILGGLPMAVLIRDYFDASPLMDYAAINRLAKNAIQDRGVEPRAAVHEACDYYLGVAYVPKLLPISENVYSQGQRVRKARRKSRIEKGIQLNLLDAG